MLGRARREAVAPRSLPAPGRRRRALRRRARVPTGRAGARDVLPQRPLTLPRVQAGERRPGAVDETSSRSGSRSAPRRVLVGLTEIAGYACNLRAGLRALGVEADVLDLQPGTFGFGDDVPPTRLMRALQRASRARLARRPGSAGRRLRAAAQVLLTLPVLAQALRRYDAFVFLYDTAFLRQRELPLLRLLGKRVVYVFCGSDDRPTYLDGGRSAAGDDPVAACVASVRRKKRLLRRVERYATAVVTNPAHGLLHERPFACFPAIGIPREAGDEPPPTRRSGRPRILHAPTHPAAKGTARVRAALERLRARGYAFDYEELQGVSNGELRERLRRCDLVVDQVFGDTPMGGLVADAAVAGKPAVVAGYAWDELRRFLPAEAFPPSELCAPDGLEDAIARLLEDERRRLELGRRARAFVAERWSATAVAGRILDLLDGRERPEWMCDPAELRYVLGWGQPAERSLALVRAIVERAGTAALGLADKPRAEALLLELAGARAS
jgi:glycosyltransferase involved in cell wall biosynthesis